MSLMFNLFYAAVVKPVSVGKKGWLVWRVQSPYTREKCMESKHGTENGADAEQIVLKSSGFCNALP